MEKLEGSVLGTVYRNEENGYSVLSVRFGKNEYTVVGVLPELAAGEQALFTGEWTEHKSYGRQFKCTLCEIVMPTTLLGLERYLGSGLIRGIGPPTARLIVSAFGEETLSVLSEHPNKLTTLPGIGKKRAAMIAESFREQQGIRRSLVFLQSYGVPPSLSVKIAQRYGDRTPEIIRENPYRLCEDIEGIGFLTADRIGLTLGVPPESEDRIGSALRYTLREAANSAGHVYLPEEELLRQTCGLLRVPEELCAATLTAMLLKRRMVAEADSDGARRIYEPFFYDAELECAGRLRELSAVRPPSPFPGRGKHGADRAISAFERERGITFSPKQREAITQSLDNGVFVITGGPGTGKTTIITCVLELLSSAGKTVLCAPTGRAAKRMQEATGTESKTIHRLLEYSREEAGFARNENHPLEADCVIADEASMIDLPLMVALLRALEPGMRLILVGDADQLPSVGPGNVLGDILASGVLPCVRLEEIYRQSESSRIALNAHRINHGEMPLLNGKGTDFFFERRPFARDAGDTIVALAATRLPAYLGYVPADTPAGSPLWQEARARSARNIQVLAPAKKGDCGVFALNALLQQALNPPTASSRELTWGETVFRTGDKVIQTRNNYDLAWRRETLSQTETGSGIFNGDIGFVTDISQEDHSLTVLFDEDREVEYASADLDDLSLAYCLSVHKSQGSEFPVVIMPVVSGPPMLLTRNLFYTALTRAKSLVVLVGTEEIIQTMVRNDHVARRYTTLSQRLREWMEEG